MNTIYCNGIGYVCELINEKHCLFGKHSEISRAIHTALMRGYNC